MATIITLLGRCYCTANFPNPHSVGLPRELGMEDCRPVSTPMEPEALQDIYADSPLLSTAEMKKYQAKTRKLTWAANNCVPEISFALNTLSQFASAR
ncbi:hypothetical protein TWF481_008683 [Arthrobotrys musiformis]|uniref:Uncharacterized protein n=1 Tax=Arthrobotrys musiformis TaxID=47236 RepID=A0AAV9WAA8_9PEZI